jgi:hypothetical protein
MASLIAQMCFAVLVGARDLRSGPKEPGDARRQARERRARHRPGNPALRVAEEQRGKASDRTFHGLSDHLALCHAWFAARGCGRVRQLANGSRRGRRYWLDVGSAAVRSTDGHRRNWLDSNAALRSAPAATATERASLQGGVLLRLDRCDGTWCEVTVRRHGLIGYVRQVDLWGVYRNEVVG